MLKETKAKVGKTLQCDKSNYVILHGIDASKKRLKEYTDKALDAVAPFGEKSQMLFCVVQDAVGTQIMNKWVASMEFRISIVLVLVLLPFFSSCGGSGGSYDSKPATRIIVNENFPGYEEASGWDDSWTQGVGSISFFSEDPGFARLALSGPSEAAIYHNAEKQNDGDRSGFLYGMLDIRLRNSDNNGWGDSSGLGSRGWGFWNKETAPENSIAIWFMSISPESNELFQGTRIWILSEGGQILFYDLNINLTQWHIYRIEWRRDYIGVFVDDLSNPLVEVTDEVHIPNVPLIFTVWIDNYRFSENHTDVEIGYLTIPEGQQFIDVDYVWISN